MFEVFNNDNLSAVVNKTPIICYYAELGACGSPGLILVVYDDELSYGYSAYDNNVLTKSIIEHIPEMNSLIRFYTNISYKRECHMENLSYVYLGLGNHALLRNDIYEEMMKMDKDYAINKFRKIFEKYSKTPVKDAYSQIKETINGHI